MSLKNNHSGCLICGGELYYTPDKPLLAVCHYCGKEEITYSFCIEGHYVCNECHREGILEAVEKKCIGSSLADPVALALEIFDLPGLHMHGPEYHSIVPAVLVAACNNYCGERNDRAVREAIERGKLMPGGLCGSHGACGAGVGAGIAYSIIHGVTPYSKEDRGEANRMTALALEAISKCGGPRCCKRDSVIAIEIAAKHFGCYPNNINTKYICSQFPENEKCIGEKCPYYPISEINKE